MKKAIALMLAALLALSMVTAFAAEYTDKETVKKVQQALNDAGYNCGTPDGAAGKKTKAAIKDYQAANGLAQTGTIDDALLQALGLAVSGAAEAPTGDGEKEITFQGVPWGTKSENLCKALTDAGFMVGSKSSRTMFDQILKSVTDNLGYGVLLVSDKQLVITPREMSDYAPVMANTSLGSMKENGKSWMSPIAGYDVQMWAPSFVCKDGSALLECIEIMLDAVDQDAAYQDLLAKLSTVYGKSQHGEDQYGNEMTEVWQGANNTAVVLHAYMSGGKINMFRLCYGKTDAAALAAEAMGQVPANNGVDAGDTGGL